MSGKIKGKIQIETYEDILRGEEDSVFEVELKELHPFKNHPFKVKDDESMKKLVESVKKDKVIEPGLVRPMAGGGYEIISGHRRKRACELAGFKTMPVRIRMLDDDQATIAMIEANLQQRDEILPSEKAFAYKMKLETMSHQGKTKDLEEEDGTSRQVVEKLVTADQVGKDFGESGRQVQRYIRLTELIDPLLDMVDRKKIKLNPAVEVSYLTADQQKILLEIIYEESATLSLSKAKQLKKLSQENKYTKESVYAVMVLTTKKERQITISHTMVARYFEPDTSDEEIERVIYQLLDEWNKKGER
ncbi:MAG: ParB/RepB/Spo0J family partition protein [Lachnospiraceae bacterium]|nr:ParB/RepB/Spo0J family partition protein [Lachnospiraceae bacterium]